MSGADSHAGTVPPMPARATTSGSVDPLVGTAPAGGPRILGAVAVDVALVSWIGLVAGVMFALDVPVLGWLCVAGAVLAVGLTLRSLALTGRTAGSVATGTRTLVRASGVSAGRHLLAAMVTGRLATFDILRGRDPLTPALAPFRFAAPAAGAAAHRPHVRGVSPVVHLDSGEALRLGRALVLGRTPTVSPETPNATFPWTDLTRTVSRSHVRLEWDGRRVWVTDLGSANGTVVRQASGWQALVPFQRTAFALGFELELGDRSALVVDQHPTAEPTAAPEP